ncbi:MAG: chromate resistance protein ChrB domain-containing protein [Acidobacteriota bacterium]
MNWLLLLHQIPPKPPYFRAKILRRLSQVGALAVKNSAYLLPDNEETLEDFEWIRREITGEGGSAWLFRAEGAGGFSEDQIQKSFRALRDTDYEELLANAAEMDDAKLTARFEEIQKIDFFGHPGRAQIETLLEQRRRRAENEASESASNYQGRTWVTRAGVKVDRIGSAWLIRRFIDADAAFRFVDTNSYKHSAEELRFDMYEGEFTHEGELCTFEVLIARHGLLAKYPALQPLAEMVHDIDLKDGRYQRAETSGLSRMLDGLCARTRDDEQRLQQGGQIFDSLYESFAG